MNSRHGNLEQFDKLNTAEIETLVALYDQEWWTRGRKPEDVERMLAHCDIVIAYREVKSRQLVGFARVLTDYVYKAFIFDVIVDHAYRGHGLGRVLMDEVIKHPDLETVRAMELYCLPEMIPFYRKWTFEPVTNEAPFCLMRRLHHP